MLFFKFQGVIARLLPWDKPAYKLGDQSQA